jgi:hypothetical protein
MLARVFTPFFTGHRGREIKRERGKKSEKEREREL